MLSNAYKSTEFGSRPTNKADRSIIIKSYFYIFLSLNVLQAFM